MEALTYGLDDFRFQILDFLLHLLNLQNVGTHLRITSHLPTQTYFFISVTSDSSKGCWDASSFGTSLFAFSTSITTEQRVENLWSHTKTTLVSYLFQFLVFLRRS